jgi:uroporphyrin-III C-methyltransferase
MSAARSHPRLGKVWIVGAGPGDPQLLTVRAARLIAEADDLVIDALVAPEIYRGAAGRVIFVGKRAGRPRPSQRRIEEILVQLAREGRSVVRLKGGDPSLFARLAEEVHALEAAGISYEIVPGVSSLLAVPLAAGIPLTERDLADRVVVMTGHRSADEGAEPAIDLPRYDDRTTYVVFMALGRLAEVIEAAMEKGFPADLPAVVVSKATLADERWIAARLEAIAESAAAAAIEAPATLLIGRVAERLAHPGSGREATLAELTAPAARRPAS